MESHLRPLRVLVVDDEDLILRAFVRTFRSRFAVVTARGAAEALLRLEREAFDVILTDFSMPDMDGARLLEAVALRFPRVARLMFTADPGEPGVEAARRFAAAVLPKPWDVNQVHLSIEAAAVPR